MNNCEEPPFRRKEFKASDCCYEFYKKQYEDYLCNEPEPLVQPFEPTMCNLHTLRHEWLTASDVVFYYKDIYNEPDIYKKPCPKPPPIIKEEC